MILFWITLVVMGFVILKASLEIIHTSKTGNIEESEIHANQHMVYLLMICLYEVVNTIAYLASEYLIEKRAVAGEQTSYLIFITVAFVNLIFLLIINHFKQERLGRVRTLKFFDIFKFH